MGSPSSRRGCWPDCEGEWTWPASFVRYARCSDPSPSGTKAGGMAEQTNSSIVITAQPAAIMDVIAHFDAYPDWAQGMEKADVVEQGPTVAPGVYFELTPARSRTPTRSATTGTAWSR